VDVGLQTPAVLQSKPNARSGVAIDRSTLYPVFSNRVVNTSRERITTQQGRWPQMMKAAAPPATAPADACDQTTAPRWQRPSGLFAFVANEASRRILRRSGTAAQHTIARQAAWQSEGPHSICTAPVDAGPHTSRGLSSNLLDP